MKKLFCFFFSSELGYCIFLACCFIGLCIFSEIFSGGPPGIPKSSRQYSEEFKKNRQLNRKLLESLARGEMIIKKMEADLSSVNQIISGEAKYSPQNYFNKKKTNEYHFRNKFESKPLPLSHNQFTTKIISIIDGDNLKIDYKGQKESLRLIGIDTPESKDNKKAKWDAKKSGKDIETIIEMGKIAMEYVEGLVKADDNIKIEFDIQERDKYGRLLGYVYLANGKMLNEEIIKAGYANVITVPPNVKYKDRFLKAYQEAREGKKGL